jgi:septum formation protein
VSAADSVRLLLASRSPRRAELLDAMGLRYQVCAADVDESVLPGEAPADYVVRLALAKARAAACPGALALGADTSVVLDERILGKPADRTQGMEMLLALAGRRHTVVTGVAVCGPDLVADAGGGPGVRSGACRSVCVSTEVTFRDIDPWEAAAYWNTGEPADKAGGYGIQGIGGIFVESIRGSYSAVVGLPLAETERLLRDCGLDTWRERMHG